VRVLLDESVPRQLAARLVGHHVSTVPREGWSGLKNAELLNRVSESFDALVTGDRNLQSQQNYTSLNFGIIVLVAPDNRVETIVALADRVLVALSEVQPGRLVQVEA